MLDTDTRRCPFQKDDCVHGECALWVANPQNTSIGDCAFVKIAVELTTANDPAGKY